VKGESADPHSGFVSVKSGWVNLRNRAGDLQLEEKKPEGLTSLDGVSAGDKLRVLAKATIRTGSDPTSEVAGALRKGSVFEVMDAVMHVGDSDDEDDEAAGGRLRVQCAKGWTSTVSARGVVMCERLSEEEEASKAAELKLDFDPSSGKGGTISSKAKAKQPEPEPEPEVEPVGVSVDAITGIVSYDVKQGRSKLQLQVGSMALQVFKGGKPVDNMLYKDMASWQVSFCCICRCLLPAV
jgi:hypothetical protein